SYSARRASTVADGSVGENRLYFFSHRAKTDFVAPIADRDDRDTYCAARIRQDINAGHRSDWTAVAPHPVVAPLLVRAIPLDEDNDRRVDVSDQLFRRPGGFFTIYSREEIEAVFTESRDC